MRKCREMSVSRACQCSVMSVNRVHWCRAKISTRAKDIMIFAYECTSDKECFHHIKPFCWYVQHHHSNKHFIITTHSMLSCFDVSAVLPRPRRHGYHSFVAQTTATRVPRRLAGTTRGNEGCTRAFCTDTHEKKKAVKKDMKAGSRDGERVMLSPGFPWSTLSSKNSKVLFQIYYFKTLKRFFKFAFSFAVDSETSVCNRKTKSVISFSLST